MTTLNSASPQPEKWPSGTFLGVLPMDDQRHLDALGRLQEFAAGSRLLRQGDRSEHVIVLLSGCVKVTADTVEGHHALLAVRVGGDIVGELAGLDGSPRMATVTAAGLVRGRVLDRATFDGFLRQHPAGGAAVSATMAAKFRWSTQRRLDFGAYPVIVRLAKVMLELGRRHGRAERDGIHIVPELTQPEWAALIGASEPATHRALTELRRGGLVRTRYRRTIIVGPRELEQLAEPS